MSQSSQKNSPQRLLDSNVWVPGRSWFNRSETNNWTGLPGRAMPVYCDHYPANSKIKMRIMSKFESFPTLTPLKGNYKLDYNVFFCPTRVYTPELRTNNVQDIGTIEEVQFPQLVFGKQATGDPMHVVPVGSVLNRLGLPPYESNKARGLWSSYDALQESWQTYDALPEGVPTRKNAIPWLAYLDIWARNFANPNEPSIPVENYSLYGGGTTSSGELIVGHMVSNYSHVSLSTIQRYIANVGFGASIGDQVVSSAPNDSKQISVSGGFQFRTEEGGTWNPLSVAIATTSIGVGDVIKYLGNLSLPQGLLPTTYMADYFSTWIASDQYDRAQVSLDRVTTITSLRVAQRRFISLAKQLFSSRTYKDWNYTQYGAKLKMCDYPIFVGKDSLLFNFDTLRATAQTNADENGYLGAGAGVGKGVQNMKPIKFETEEDGYIMVIATLTPEVNYYRGHKKYFDYLGMEDVPLPDYDAVGFQDILRDEVQCDYTESDTESVGKVPYAYQVMTGQNRSSGLMQTPAFRSWVNNREEPDPTTYVDPARYNYNFVRVGQNDDNFVIDTLFDISAKQPFSKQLINTSY